MGSVRVVEGAVAEADLDVGNPNVVGRAVNERAELGADRNHARVTDGVAEEVGRQLLAGVLLGGRLLAERGKGALELRGHGVKQRRLGLLGVRGDGQGEERG